MAKGTLPQSSYSRACILKQIPTYAILVIDTASDALLAPAGGPKPLLICF